MSKDSTSAGEGGKGSKTTTWRKNFLFIFQYSYKNIHPKLFELRDEQRDGAAPRLSVAPTRTNPKMKEEWMSFLFIPTVYLLRGAVCGERTGHYRPPKQFEITKQHTAETKKGREKKRTDGDKN